MQLKNLVATSLAAVTLSASALGLGVSAAPVEAAESIPSPIQVVKLADPRPDPIPEFQLQQAVTLGHRPDLVIQDWRASPDADTSDPHNDVARGKPYNVCYPVRNIGSAAAGPFQVSGGGLGIPFNPTQPHPGLAAGATATGCLVYPTTPAPGVYLLEVAADSANAVAESNETNNGRVEAIFVAP